MTNFQTYHWRICALNDDGQAEIWSVTYSLRVEFGVEINDLSPANERQNYCTVIIRVLIFFLDTCMFIHVKLSEVDKDLSAVNYNFPDGVSVPQPFINQQTAQLKMCMVFQKNRFKKECNAVHQKRVL